MGFCKNYLDSYSIEKIKLSDKEIWDKLYHSLTGFYKPIYDRLSPEDIYKLYQNRKQELINDRQPTKIKNIEKIEIDKLLLEFSDRYKHTIIGFFRDKQYQRKISH
jgi:hypothetical protein